MKHSLPFVAAVVTACIVCTPAFADDTVEISQIQEKASKAERAGDFSAARQAYLDAIAWVEALDPERKQRFVELEAIEYDALGTVDEKDGKTAEAIKAYGMAVAHARTDRVLINAVHALSRMQTLSLQEQDCAGATKAAKGANFLADSYPMYMGAKMKALTTLGKCDAKLGMTDVAKQEFDAAWNAAEGMGNIGQDDLDDLLESSSKLYRGMGLAQMADAAIAHAEALRSKTKVFAVSTTPPKIDTNAASGDVKPSFENLNVCKPEYPAEAMAAKEQGDVKIRFDVDQDGKLIQASILRSSGSRALDRATFQALSKCKFKPGMREGQTVKGSFDAAYGWRLPQ